MKVITLKSLHEREQHSFHLVNPSPWPIMTSFSIFTGAWSLVAWFHYYTYSTAILILAVTLVAFALWRWFLCIIIESEDYHTSEVQQGILLGMALFITSEIMFFFSFFWGFFHFSLAPSIWTGGVWPPKGIIPMVWYALPLLNTCILLSSGVTVTYAHKAIVADNKKGLWHFLLWTVMFGILFTFFQGYEYCNANFSINDGVYGSIFYLLTGFHGLHVLIGTIFLMVCLFRLPKFKKDQHIGYICAIWYWHFVDIVWIFLFIAVYIWGA
jgi:cytochrome c oxidase subunit 3